MKKTPLVRQRLRWAAALVTALLLTGCGGRAPDDEGLRESFAAQLAANDFARNVQRNGNEITFTGPAAVGGGDGKWRVRIDSAVVEPSDDPKSPYKGTVKSSWYSDEALVSPTGNEANLPIELTSNGLAQDCWALWNPESERWEWE